MEDWEDEAYDDEATEEEELARCWVKKPKLFIPNTSNEGQDEKVREVRERQ
jgi:hypothetical protein